MNKEKKKRRRLKIVFTIVAICTIFSLLTISVFAYQTGIPYSPNVYAGVNTFLYSPVERITYVTRTATNYYLKDIPFSDSFTVYNTPAWVGHGEPLRITSTGQVTYSNEVNTSITAIETISSQRTGHVEALGTDYSPYFKNGWCDCVRVAITTNSDYSSAGQCYQRAIVDFADTFIPNFIANDSLYYNCTPQFRIFRPATMGACTYSLRCTVTGRSSLDGKVYSQDIALNDVTDNDPDTTVEYNGIQQNLWAFNIYKLILDQLNTDFEGCNYWHITNLSVILGKQQMNLASMTADIGGASGIDLYFPSVRPYDLSKIDEIDEAFNVKSPVNYDVNYLRNYNGQLDLAADGADDLEISSVGDFIGQITRGFLDIYIIPGISLGGILFTCLSIGFIVVVLRYFAGG